MLGLKLQLPVRLGVSCAFGCFPGLAVVRRCAMWPRRPRVRARQGHSLTLAVIRAWKHLSQDQIRTKTTKHLSLSLSPSVSSRPSHYVRCTVLSVRVPSDAGCHCQPAPSPRAQPFARLGSASRLSRECRWGSFAAAGRWAYGALAAGRGATGGWAGCTPAGPGGRGPPQAPQDAAPTGCGSCCCQWRASSLRCVRGWAMVGPCMCGGKLTTESRVLCCNSLSRLLGIRWVIRPVWRGAPFKSFQGAESPGCSLRVGPMTVEVPFLPCI